ncbi:MAG: NADH-quinone oxidoreductase subunit N [Nitrospiraceae bacterium]|nr:MAG: NADH-quinone oxidoreductase subunit N [Nitrospiraceae bacterium]
MNAADIIILLPLIVISAAAVIVMMTIAFYRSHVLTSVLTIAGLAAAFIALLVISPMAPRSVTTVLIMDGYALFYIGLVIAAAIAVSALSFDYLKGRACNQDEYYLLLLLATLGACVLAASSHFVSFFLGLEILSVSLYALIAYLRVSERGNEAGLKYLVLAGASSAFLLFGMALVYARFGTMELAQVAQNSGAEKDLMLFTGLALIIVGAGFKLAAVPFHMWTSDVYEGAPAPVTAFVATVSKGAVFALLLRYFTVVDIRNYTALFAIFTIIAISSMFTGNLLALMQNNIKRILAYSSIAHMGYLLVAFLASGPLAINAVSFYLAAYFVTTLGAFGIITILSGKDRDADELNDYCGMAWQRPWLTGIFTAMLLSLAGIPLTAGFLGKFYVVTAGANSALWPLVIILVITSAIGLYYYLRIIIVLYEQPEHEGPGPMLQHVTLTGHFVMTALAVMLIWIGVYPSPIISIIQAAVAGLK